MGPVGGFSDAGMKKMREKSDKLLTNSFYEKEIGCINLIKLCYHYKNIIKL